MKINKLIWDSLTFTRNNSVISRGISFFIVSLILMNVIAVICGTFESVQSKYSNILDKFEVISVIIFSIEYLTRIGFCVSDEKYSKSISGRIKYVKSPLALIDLLAILPFYTCCLNIDLRFIRMFRLVRLIRLLKLVRYFKALDLLSRVIKSKKEELIVSFGLILLLLLTSSFIIFHFEHEVQPEKFQNLLSSIWCAFSTFTFIGNGDIYPITIFGKSLLAIIALLFIGIFGLPAGIITSGFIEEMNKTKEKSKCPHCGKEI
jgi:voltage-gated potassium channel